MKQLFLALFCGVWALGAFAQQPAYDIKVTMPAPADKYIYLAHYLGNTQFIKVDSAKAQNGQLRFTGKEPLQGGLYLIVYSPSIFYDFIVSGQPTEAFMEVKADTADYVGTAKFTNSKENDILFTYRRFLNQKNQEAKAAQAGSPEAVKNRMEKLQEEVQQFTESFIKKHEGTFAGKILKANNDPVVPKVLPKLPNGRTDSTFAFRYYKANYLKGLDFSDDRLIRTPFLQSKIETYFKNLVYQTPDSVIVDADRVLSQVKKNKDVYRFVLWNVSNKYENSNVLGMDKVFVHLAENYYLKDATWLDSTQRAKFQERVSTMKPLLLDNPFPTLYYTDLNGVEKKMNDQPANYTVLVFYSPDCGHCKDAAPHLAKFAKDYAAKGVKVYNIGVDYDVAKVKDFVKKFGLDTIENGWDGKGRYNFKNNFDVYTTPTTYVLDKNKRIIARKLPEQELHLFMDYYLKKEAK